MKSRPSANGYFQLADFAYRAGQVKTGDRAAEEAVRRTPPDQRNTVRSLIKDTKKQGAQFAEALKKAKKAAAQAAASQGCRAPSPARASARCPARARPAPAEQAAKGLP